MSPPLSSHSTYGQVLNDLSCQPLTILCGAGISYNSGLPIVYQFTDAIFDEFGLTEEERISFHSSVYPFEAFMELLEDESDIEPLLTIFQNGAFNTNHLLLAKLVKAGKLRNIVTTNFDLLIEQALIDVGYQPNKDFKVYQSESDFSNISWDGNSVNLIKIHGSAGDLDNMAINMRLVAGQESYENKNNIIRQLFNRQLNPLVLILGYSCSDIFDITPVIETIKDNQSEVILLEHLNDSNVRTESLSLRANKNPFTAFSAGTRVFCQADIFVRAIWEANLLGPYEELKPLPPDWRANTRRWYSASVTSNSAGFANQICGRMFDNICCYDLSIKHYEKAIAIAFGASDNFRIGSELGNLGMVHNKLDRYDEALKCLNTSIDFCRRLDNIQGQISQLQAIGNTYRNLGKYGEATCAMSEAISLIRTHGRPIDLCTTLGNLALIYNLTQQYEKTIITAEEAMEISRRLGVKNSEGSHLSSLGIAYFSVGDRIKGITCLRQSLHINRQIGHDTNICNSLCNLAKLLKYDQQYDESLTLLAEALELARRLNLRQAEGLIFFLKGDISLATGQRLAAKTELMHALQVFSLIFEADHPFVMATIGTLSDANLL